MTPEARDYLDKAHDHLDEGLKIAGIGLARAGARSAYYAVFHAAEAFIVERTGKIAKTHSGLRAEFARLLKHSAADRRLATFLAQAYKYKEIGDYGLGREAAITHEEAEEALASAARFIERVEALLD